MLTMYGNTARLWRYQIDYTETLTGPEPMPAAIPDENGVCPDTADGAEAPDSATDANSVTLNHSQCVTSEAEKDAWLSALGEAVTAVTVLDQTGNEWLDGLEFPSREDALAALAMGETAYTEYHAAQSRESLQQRVAALEAENTEILLAMTELYESML